MSDHHCSTNFILPLDEPAVPTMPMARLLYAHFVRGGSIAEAIDLVEKAELTAAATEPDPRTANKRGTRLAPSWKPAPSEVAFALGRGMNPHLVEAEAEKFRNYWVAKAGANAAKRDWSATWRNWIITAMERSNGPTRYWSNPTRADFAPRRASTGSDAILSGMARLANRIDQKRVSAFDDRREVADDTNAAFAFDVDSGRAR